MITLAARKKYIIVFIFTNYDFSRFKFIFKIFLFRNNFLYNFKLSFEWMQLKRLASTWRMQGRYLILDNRPKSSQVNNDDICLLFYQSFLLWLSQFFCDQERRCLNSQLCCWKDALAETLFLKRQHFRNFFMAWFYNIYVNIMIARSLKVLHYML